MNCSDVDRALSDGAGWVLDDDLGFALTCVVLFGLAVALALAAEQLLRPVGAVAGGLGAAALVYAVLAATTVEPRPSCDVRVGLAVASGVLAALLVACLVRALPVLLGAGSAGIVGHYLYGTLASSASASAPFRVLGVSAYHVATVVGAAVLGGLLVRWKRTQARRLLGCVVAGVVVTGAVALLSEREDGGRPPDGALLATAVGATGGAVGLRALRARWQARRRQKGEAGRGSTATTELAGDV